MGGTRSIRRLAVVVAAFFVALCLIVPRPDFAADTNSASADKAQANDDNTFWAQHVVESYQQLQSQQESMVQEMEKSRQEAEAAAKRNKEELDARLNSIEQSVSAQREHEIESLQSAHRFTLIIVGIFAGVGFFGMLFFAVFLLRTMNRRTETMIAQFTGQAFGAGFLPAALGTGDTQVVTVNRAEQSTARFLHTIERLEKRIDELEGTADATPTSEPKKPAEPSPETIEASEPKHTTDADAAVSRPRGEHEERDARIALLFGKGQALLNLQQADTALACFDEVIALDSTNPEAFVKKGMALERLGKLDEAIDCYDRAIALDNSMTMAYLNKGGVFNRLERYGEALQCYEQALRAQQKPSIA